MDQTLGPYTSRKMREWFDKRYFDPTLLIQSGGSDAPFAPILTVFPDISTAFAEDAAPKGGSQSDKGRDRKLVTLLSFSMDDSDDYGSSWEALEQNPPK
jgi:hypothetical protein